MEPMVRAKIQVLRSDFTRRHKEQCRGGQFFEIPALNTNQRLGRGILASTSYLSHGYAGTQIRHSWIPSSISRWSCFDGGCQKFWFCFQVSYAFQYHNWSTRKRRGKRTSERFRIQSIFQTYEVLQILDFDNVRKRMSVIIRRKDGKIKLYCKGADTLIMDRLGSDTSHLLLDATKQHLDKFAADGLRTLCCSYKEIEPDYCVDWMVTSLYG